MSCTIEVNDERKGTDHVEGNRYIIVDDVSGKNAVVDPYDPGKLPLQSKVAATRALVLIKNLHRSQPSSRLQPKSTISSSGSSYLQRIIMKTTLEETRSSSQNTLE